MYTHTCVCIYIYIYIYPRVAICLFVSFFLGLESMRARIHDTLTRMSILVIFPQASVSPRANLPGGA